MLSKNLEITLRNAIFIAANYHHEYTSYEHLLLALLNDEDSKLFFNYKKIDMQKIIEKLYHYLEYNLNELVNENCTESKPTAGFRRILQQADNYVDATCGREISSLDLLAEFYLAPESYAKTCLKMLSTTRGEIIRYINKNFPYKEVNIISETVNFKDKPKIESSNIELNSFPNENSDKPNDILQNLCTNLNLKAKTGAIDLLIGREAEIQRVIEVLVRRKKNNVLLVGEPGVGKTAIAEGLAMQIVNNEVPDILQNAQIYSLDIGTMVAGTKYRGDFEERIKNLVEEFKNHPNYILFIDEIHTIMGAGSTTSGSLDASNLLKPSFARGDIRCIGATTFKEYHSHFEKDAALSRRFQKIIISEPDEQSTINILKGLKSHYEKHHNVQYSDEAINAAVMLSEKYIKNRKLPDKAIDLLDEAGARQKLLTKDKSIKIITTSDIEDLVATIVGIPKINISTSDIAQLKTLEQNLKHCIFGQDDAIDALCGSIKLARAGLKNINHPIGSYLFAGQSGVGKTELAKQLAKFCNMELIKLDMSEYIERHSIASLIGSPPGYSGYEEGGVLTEAVDKANYAVVLFDEIEKANPEIFNILLQIMDEGRLTDSTGKTVDFTHTIIILTTNVSAHAQTKAVIGFYNDDQEIGEIKSKSSLEDINKLFSPEFRNRLDKIIIFNSLDKEIINQIIEKNLRELTTQLDQKHIKLLIDSSVKEYLIQNCMIKEKGVRGLEKIIENELKQQIAEEILFGKLTSGGRVLIKANSKTNKLNFQFIGSENSKLPPISYLEKI